MNCGLGNLETLKRHLQPAASLAGETRFDAVFRDIGTWTAGMMENFCNRKFARLAGDQAVFQADRAAFVLPRYPIEAITLVEVKLKDGDGYTAQDASFIESTSAKSGIIYLADNSDVGPYWGELRLTYTGGYWFETLEPEDDGYPSGMPAGAYALPSDLQGAWLLQCREIWNKMDKLGTGLVDKPDGQSNIGGVEMAPMVKIMLWHYRQMDLV